MNKIRWMLPAFGSLAFLVFSLVVASREGLFGFVAEHQRSGWSVQILMDLVFSATVALWFVAPVARRVNVRMWPWVIATVLLGSIGLMALVARVRYAQAKGAGLPATPVPASPSLA